jgi:hypothetical protein
MRAPDGLEWLPVPTVAERLGTTPSRVRQWVSRRRVRSELVEGRRWVCWQDAAAQELASQTPGRPRRRRVRRHASGPMDS